MFQIIYKHGAVTIFALSPAVTAEAAIEFTQGQALRAFTNRYPHLTAMPEDVEIIVNAIPDPDPAEEIILLEAQQAEIRDKLIQLRAKVSAQPVKEKI